MSQTVKLYPAMEPDVLRALAALDQRALDALPLGLCVCDAQGRIVRYNHQAERLWGQVPASGEARYSGAAVLLDPEGEALSADHAPMRTVLAEGVCLRNVELMIGHRSGRRIIIESTVSPLLDDNGAVTGAIDCFRDVTDAWRARREAARNAAFLEAIVDTTPECIKVVAPDGSLVQMNASGLCMIEADAFEAVQGACVFDVIVPEHREAWVQNHARVCGGERLSWEFDIVGLKGARRHMETQAAPFVLPDGRTGQLAITRDISQRRSDAERHRVLIDELNHRVKNTLATVQSIALQTLNGAVSLERFKRGYEGRIVALSRAHDLLVRSQWRSAELRPLLEQELDAFGRGRFTLDGPKVELNPRTAITFGMIIHELATNAARHGALSADGAIDVRWRQDPVGLWLEWVETGGPRFAPSARRGFGSRLLERAVNRDLGGHVRLSHDGAGFTCRIEIPATSDILADPFPAPSAVSQA